MDERSNKRDLVLAPGEYAYMQDVTKGVVKTYTGPTVINPTAQERSIIFDAEENRFSPCSLDDAVQPVATAPEGSYLVLENPSARGDHPPAGGVHPAPDLAIGRMVNLTGPRAFALWPGEVVKLIPGHHLRSNQYVLVRVLNEDEARRNWAHAVIKPATPEGDAPSSEPPADLSVGKLLVIRGTDVSFYIPPTGLGVVPDDSGRYVRDALTLERLEYAILVDENGNKRYERGPQVVFPSPTEVFVEQLGQRKFRAIELSELHGLHVKVIAPYSEAAVEHREGDELFITGKQTAIYYPRQEHSLIRVDGRERHVAVAIPAGEGRYVVDRATGVIRVVRGPAMFLPNPIHEVLVRRVLSDRECTTFYPNNADALAYNRGLRTASDTPAKPVPETRRASIVLDARFDGAPKIGVWVGYAVMVVDPRGQRRVVTGPATILLEYDETLEVLQLSTGTPKRADKRIQTVYLRTLNNRISDLCTVETADHVAITIGYALRVGFEGDPQRWFEVEDYVQLLCDHVRSLLRAAIKRRSVDEVYANVVELVRDALLGVAAEAGPRHGLAFAENGMRVSDVEVLDVTVGDDVIADLLGDAQRQAVEEGISLVRARRGLELIRQREQITRATAEEEATTRRQRSELDLDAAADRLKAALSELEGEVRRAVAQLDVSRARNTAADFEHEADIARRRAENALVLEQERAEQQLALNVLAAEVDATVKRFAAAQGGFSEALLALSNRETLAKIAEAMSVQSFVGGKTLVDVIGKVFTGTPLAGMLERVTERSSGNGAYHAADED
ncbi:MAG TPA: SPFH domain-containing protein [Kofleriaceae bacterium]